MKKDGDFSVTINFKISKESYKQIKRVLIDLETNMSDFLRKEIERAIKNVKKNNN
jgi:hypothetical protein